VPGGERTAGSKPYLRVGVPVILAALTVLGLWLVFSGASDDGRSGNTDSGSTSSDNPERLEIGETDIDSVSDLAGLSLPDSVEDFMSARLDDDSQLDVSFTIAPDDEATFLDASGIPEPQEEQRVITHTSPLWDLNVDATIRGAADTTGDVTRAVELVDEDGRTRVRLVITPAG
jgi:hypothetical protein